MNAEPKFEAPKNELDIPSSLYLGPEMLKALEQTSRGEPLTWGATPLEPHDKNVAEQQREVERELNNFFPKKPEEVPFDLNWDTARFIHDNYVMRTVHRVSRNYESFQYRGKFDLIEIPPETVDFIERALSGHASPAELLATADILEIPTVELGSLSHPYGKERLKDFITPMREAVNEGILFYGGTLCNSKPEYEARHATYFNKAEYPNAEPSLLMTRTKKVGEIGKDIEVIERSSFVLIESRLPNGLGEQLHTIEYGKDWTEQFMQIPGFEDALTESLKTDEHRIAVPISTTSVAINRRLEETLINNKEHIETRQKQMIRSAMAAAGIKSSL